MSKTNYFIVLALLVSICSCTIFENIGEVEIPDFNYPSSIDFEQNLAAYNIYENVNSDLIPKSGFHLYELSSSLFSDYTYKQRLLKIPEGTEMKRDSDGSIEFPDGTIIVKTFYFYLDERDTSKDKVVLETRLLIKESDIWNVATYIWDDAQSEATLQLNGADTEINWINKNGNSLSTMYHFPDENECTSCHQSNSTMRPIGPTLLNLNKNVERNSLSVNQLSHFQTIGLLNSFDVTSIPTMADYTDLNASLQDRGRAYLAINCAHCHNPTAWDEAANEDYDFRYSVSNDDTGILNRKRRIRNQLLDMEMPFIGTSILDQEGTDLVIDFIESL